MKKKNDRTLVLAGDIGGTKINIGLFAQGKRRPTAKVIDTFSSIEALSLENIIKRFLERHPCHIAGACFGIGCGVAGDCLASGRVSKVVSVFTDFGLDTGFRFGLGTFSLKVASKSSPSRVS